MKAAIVSVLILSIFSAKAQEKPKTTEIKIQITENDSVKTIVESDSNKSKSFEISLNTKKKKNNAFEVSSMFTPNRNLVFAGIDFGMGGFSFSPNFNTSAPNNLDAWKVNPATSIQWAINFVEFDLRIVNEYVKISTGFGYNVKNFSFSNNYMHSKTQNGEIVSIHDTLHGLSLDKNRFRTAYLSIPLMLQFNINKNPEKSFRVGVGVVGGIRILETYRTKHNNNGQRVKSNVNRNWNTNPLIADLRLVAGYNKVNLFASYSLVPLFENNRGPELYPFSIGVNLLGMFD